MAQTCKASYPCRHFLWLPRKISGKWRWLSMQAYDVWHFFNMQGDLLEKENIGLDEDEFIAHTRLRCEDINISSYKHGPKFYVYDLLKKIGRM